jgi:hypothetical protein
MGRIRCACFAVGVVSAVITVLSAASYAIGRRIEPELRFFDPGRAPTIDEATFSNSIGYALQSDESNDVVFIGDSGCRFGIDPARITGVRSYNLGMVAGVGAPALLVTTKAYLERHPRPKLVVLCISPFSMEMDPVAHNGDAGERFVANYGPEVNGARSIQSVLYFARRGAKGSSAAHDIRNDPLQFMETETYWSLRKKTLALRGFYPLPGEHGGGIPEHNQPAALIRDDWSEGINGIATECDLAGVPLLILFSPIDAQYRDWREFRLLDAFALKLETAHGNARIAHPIVVGYEREFMWDGLHLNAAGVARFMPLVAADVEDALRK